MYFMSHDSIQEQGHIEKTEVPSIIADVLRRCRKRISRERIAKSLGISIYLLNAYACPSVRCREKGSGQIVLRRKPAFPARLVESFCQVTQDDALQRHVLGERLRLLLEVGETEAEQRHRLSKLAQVSKTPRKAKEK